MMMYVAIAVAVLMVMMLMYLMGANTAESFTGSYDEHEKKEAKRYKEI
jgi:hypothetical protein